jgi:hypothetical protein
MGSSDLDHFLPANQETMIFDFGLNIGDTIYRGYSIYEKDSCPYEVVAIDSILLMDNSYRKRFTLRGYYHASTAGFSDTLYQCWTEGIGVQRHPNYFNRYKVMIEGFLGGYLYLDGLSVSSVIYEKLIHCFHENDIQKTGSTEYCDTLPPHLLSIAEAESISPQIKLFPNPFVRETNLSVEGYLDFHVQLFDITGKLHRELYAQGTNEITIERKNLNKGIYFYKISAGKKHIGSGKIIIN